MSCLLPGAPGQTPGLFTGPRPRPGRHRRRAGPRRPPARPRPERRAYPEQPRAGRSLVGQGSSGDGGRGGGWKGVTAAAAGQVRLGRGRRRGGAGLRPGPRLSAPSRLRSSGRWSGRRRAGPEGGGGRAKDSSLSRPTCLGAPPPPLPSHPFRRCSRPSTRSCGPGRRRDHCSLAPARAPAPSAAATAASSASPRRRAHEGAVLPLPDSSVSPAPPGSAAATAAARRSSWRDPDVVGQELRRGQAGGGGAAADDITALPCSSSRSPLAARAPGEGRRKHPNTGPELGLESLCPPALGAGQSV